MEELNRMHRRTRMMSSKFLLVRGADVEGHGREAARVPQFVCDKCGARTEQEMMLECGRVVRLCAACREAFYGLLDSHLHTLKLQRRPSDGLRGLVDLMQTRDGEERDGVSNRLLAHAATFRSAELSLCPPVSPPRPPRLSLSDEPSASTATPFAAAAATAALPASSPSHRLLARKLAYARWLGDDDLLSAAAAASSFPTSPALSPPPIRREVILSERDLLLRHMKAAHSPFVGRCWGSLAPPASPEPRPRTVAAPPPSPPPVARSHLLPAASRLSKPRPRPRPRPRTVANGIEAVGEPVGSGLPDVGRTLPRHPDGRRSVSPKLLREREGLEERGSGDGATGRRMSGRWLGSQGGEENEILTRKDVLRAGREVRRAMRVVLSSA